MLRAALLVAAAPAVAADCPSCDLVPCGQCQEGCPGSQGGCPSGSSRNKCPDKNKGYHPSSCLSPPPPAPPPHSFCSESGWTQVWADEFDGSTLDNSSWTLDLAAGDSRVRDSQGTADNVYLEGGALVLRSQRQVAGSYNFTSGAVQTRGKHSWQGLTRACVSAKLPGGGGKGQGIWPAHWMMPDNSACWPSNGEIDIMEMINGNGDTHGTYHWKSSGCGEPHSSKGGQKQETADWATAYHEYAVEYDGRGYVAFALDGNVFINITNGEYYDVPYYMILNTAVGGPWPGPPSAATTFPTYHYIDYVRVVQPQ